MSRQKPDAPQALTPVTPEVPAPVVAQEAPAPVADSAPAAETPAPLPVQQSASRTTKPVKVESYRDPKFATTLPNGLTIYNFTNEGA